MDKQNIRFFFLLAVMTVGMFLYNAWQTEHAVSSSNKDSNDTVRLGGGDTNKIAEVATNDLAADHVARDLPRAPQSYEIGSKANNGGKNEALATEKFAMRSNDAATEPKNKVSVSTDVLNLTIDLHGGDVVRVELPHYPQELKPDTAGFVLLDNSGESDRFYVAQSGLLSEVGPDSAKRGRALYSTSKADYKLTGDKLAVDLRYRTETGVDIIKRLSFSKGSYVVEVEYLISNQGSAEYKGSLFGRLRRTRPSEQEASILNPMRSYTGAAVTTPEKKYQKLTFDDMDKKSFKQFVQGGWAAVVEHYFTSAWVPPSEAKNYYQSEVFADKSYGVGFVGEQVVVPAGGKDTVTAKLYVGPRITDTLKELAPGLDLTIDYGMLWWLCQPIFLLLKQLFTWVGNWGIAIILITCSIKLLFFRLSATSYRSMGNMKKLQPRIEALKQRCADDKQQFSQAVMELYRKEKVNPFGGCLPMLVQIPVFISLYYVLLESVELRHAPFALWIADLSAKDPFFVLPILMGASMLLQQKMNPAPADPVQAKVMMAMPIVFTVIFLNFPAGLVLYWVVNNVLSIAQQWFITRKIEAEA